ncbi:unnamed protein product [Lupinus luteus]|uniref:Uncharacterized protein n=1 Tax=Lupinus luteus TaxID=3873 RepID=A0AAV1YF53_LUPLU
MELKWKLYCEAKQNLISPTHDQNKSAIQTTNTSFSSLFIFMLHPSLFTYSTSRTSSTTTRCSTIQREPGTVQLTLSLDTSFAANSSMNLVSESAKNSSISSEVVLLDRKISQVMLDLAEIEYSRIEFPDISVVKENQQNGY